MEEKKSCIIGEGLYLDIILTAMRHHTGQDSSKNNLVVVTMGEERRSLIRKKYSVQTATDVKSAVKDAGIIVLLPATIEKGKMIMEEIAPFVQKDALVVSMVYRLPMKEIEQCFPGNPVLRLALNPSIVSGSGIGAYIVGSNASQDAAFFAKMVISALGRDVSVSSEEEFDIVWDIIFVETVHAYSTLQGFIDCGEKAGLSEKQAKYIAGQVFAGVIKTVMGADDNTKTIIEQGKNQESKSVWELGIKLGRYYGFQETMEKAMSMNQ